MSIIKLSRIQSGFTLLEVMIAMVIFSIGLLGLAGLQARGIQSTGMSQGRSIAIIQAYDMADRIRANPVGVTNGNYNAIPLGLSPAMDCINVTCVPADLAAFDAFEWNTNNSNVLPSGNGRVDIDLTGTQFTITVMWDEDRTGVAGTNCSGDPTVDLKCYTMVIAP
jgi:type IV pilus assembly protein PilV